MMRLAISGNVENHVFNLDDSETLRAREAVVWTRTWTTRAGERAKGPGARTVARTLADRPLRKLRRLAQHLCELQRTLSSEASADFIR